MRALVVILASVGVVCVCQARIITVDDDLPADFNNIQAAIDDANDGDTVIVADGTYTGPGNRDIDFNGLAITVRSIDPNDANVVAETIIDCEGTLQEYHRGFYFHSGEGPNSVLAGLTIKNGYADAGGGIYCSSSSPTITRCIISRNVGEYVGGGISCGSGTITHCLVTNNGADMNGGGISCGSGTVIRYCRIINNRAFLGSGGGIGVNGSATISHCVISGNEGQYPGGGGIYCGGSGTNINNCIITNNGDSETDFGGGIFCRFDSTAAIRNCTILYNTAQEGGSGIYNDGSNPTIVNCIIRDNKESDQIGGSPIVTYSNIQDGYGGEGNINADPCLVDPLNEDYHLLENSPCIDAGDPFYIPIPGETDIDDEPRVMNGRVEMGVDEFTSALIPALMISPTSFEFNADEDGPNPEVQILSIRNTGGGGTLYWQVVEDCSWLGVEPNSGDCVLEVDEVVVSVDVTGLSAGVYSCLLAVNGMNAANSPQGVPVTLYVRDIDGELHVPEQYPTIQTAIDAAIDGDVVIVEPNTYTGPGNRDIDFKGKVITVRGIDPEDPCVVAATVIDCENVSGHRGFYFHSGEDSNSVVSGFTIKRGRIRGSDAKGGGIYCSGSSPTIENCIITNNNVRGDDGSCEGIIGGHSAYGGGIYCTDSSSPIIRNCTISNNIIQGGKADFMCDSCSGPMSGGSAHGGGIYCNASSSPIISNCTISNNTGQGGRGSSCPEVGGTGGGRGYGGGVYCGSDCNPTIKNCSISYNTLQGGYGGGAVFEYGPGAGGVSCGAGIYCSSNGTATIDNCVINNNLAVGGSTHYDFNPRYTVGPGAGKGGGVYGSVIISNSVINENKVYSGEDGFPPESEVFGGGLYCTGSSFITNCLITNNKLTGFWEGDISGSAVYCEPDSNVTIRNCTICRNGGGSAVDSLGTPLVTIMDSILWNNGYDVKSSFAVTYSCIEQIVSGIGNIHTNPSFVSGPLGDYYLSQIAAGQGLDSPCVDAGSDTAANLGMHQFTTRTDEMRDKGMVDMGYHYPCAIGSADIDGSYFVDLIDYAIFANDFNSRAFLKIPKGAVTVDGNLSEWSGNVAWLSLDKVFHGNPADANEASIALRWDPNTNKIYAAVIVNDSNHVFSDEYIQWNASDRIEIYGQGEADGGTGWCGIYDVAQQYMMGPNTSGGCWATWALGETLGGDAGVEYAVTVDGEKIIHEAGVLMFDDYGGFSGEPTVVTNLSLGRVVGFDILVSTRWAVDGFGMLSENLMTAKSGDAGQFAKYILVEQIGDSPYFPFAADLDGNGVADYVDLDFLFEKWLEGTTP